VFFCGQAASVVVDGDGDGVVHSMAGQRDPGRSAVRNGVAHQVVHRQPQSSWN